MFNLYCTVTQMTGFPAVTESSTSLVMSFFFHDRSQNTLQWGTRALNQTYRIHQMHCYQMLLLASRLGLLLADIETDAILHLFTMNPDQDGQSIAIMGILGYEYIKVGACKFIFKSRRRQL